MADYQIRVQIIVRHKWLVLLAAALYLLAGRFSAWVNDRCVRVEGSA